MAELPRPAVKRKEVGIVDPALSFCLWVQVGSGRSDGLSVRRTGCIRMASGLRLDIESPKHGWTDVRLTAPGVELAFTASYTPRDSISDLAHAAMGVIAGVPDQVVTWNGEPTEYDFQFVTEGRRTRLEVYEFPDH